MKIKKSNLETFYLAIKGTEGVLSLSESRIRDSFIKPVTETLELLYKDRTKIYETFCDKTEEGKPDIKNNQYKFAPEVIENLNAELKTLTSEEVELEAPEKLKDILEKTEYKPKVGEIAILDEIISQL